MKLFAEQNRNGNHLNELCYSVCRLADFLSVTTGWSKRRIITNGVQRLEVLILDQRIQISVRLDPWLNTYWGPPASSDPSASGWGDLTYALATPIQNQGCEAARRLTSAECEPDELNTLSLLLCTLATTSLIHATVTLLFWCFPLRRDRKCVTSPAECRS